MSSSNPSPVTTARQRNRLLTIIISFVLLALFLIAVVGAAWYKQLRFKHAPVPPPVYGTVSAPTFTDSTGTSFSLSQLQGRIWVMDSIYTRCGGQCPIMSTNMKSLQDWLVKKEQGGVKLVSLTVDPEHDTPTELTRYARMFKADTSRWHFLTASKKEIYDYLMNDFKLGVDENKDQPEEEMFIHSDKFVLVDRDLNIRGYYSGMDEEDMKKLRLAITSLSRDGSAAPTADPNSVKNTTSSLTGS